MANLDLCEFPRPMLHAAMCQHVPPTEALIWVRGAQGELLGYSPLTFSLCTGSIRAASDRASVSADFTVL